MTQLINFRTIIAPSFPSDTPEAREISEDIYLAVTEMGVQLHFFESCVSLFEFLSQHTKESPAGDDSELMKRALWRLVPAQQGALAIWHFRKCIDSLRSTVNRNRTIASAVDTAAIKMAIEHTFRAKFPDWDKLRFGVAHHSEAHLTASAGMKHGVAGPKVLGLEISENDRLQASGIIAGRLIMTIDGHEVSYAIDQSSVEALRLVSNQIVDALEVRRSES